MVHQGVAIENALVVAPDDIEVLISQGQAIPHDVAFTKPGTFPVPALADHILDGVELVFTAKGVYHKLLSSKLKLPLFFAESFRTRLLLLHR